MEVGAETLDNGNACSAMCWLAGRTDFRGEPLPLPDFDPENAAQRDQLMTKLKEKPAARGAELIFP
jgi:hypothetical protein